MWAVNIDLMINFLQAKLGQTCKLGLKYPKKIQWIQNTLYEEDGESLVCVAVSYRVTFLDLHILHLPQCSFVGPLETTREKGLG